ncbi:MAG TPA: type II toxin-antitoxin system prevent-host-death family antitoxin [Turneriella sp.]|nr:type II toxin-antitoxin system prevent-host-death family antitoxin [Turneriella sp.]
MITSAAKFKAECLSLIDHVYENHEEITVTKRGKPMARLIPIEQKTPKPLFGYMKDSMTSCGDIVSPIGEEWDVEK